MASRLLQAPTSPILRYGPALTAAGLALVLWLVFRTLISPSPFLLFLAAVMFSAWYGGFGPGLLVTVIGALTSAFFFFPPIYSLSIGTPQGLAQVSVFLIVALVVTWLNAVLRDAQQRAVALAEGRDRALAEIEEARRRATFLAKANEQLARSLEYETTLANVARLAVPELGDWCGVDVVDEDGSLRRLAVAHVDPAKVELARELEQRYPTDPESAGGVPGVLRSRESQLYTEIPDALLEAAARDAEHLQMMRDLGLKSAMLVPMLARGRALGVLTFVSAESGRSYGPEDLAFAEDLARAAGLAVDNARLYREVQRAVETRDEFLASASHDLKNPLSSIKAVAQVLERRTTGRPIDPERLKAGLGSIDAATTRMAAQIDEMLDVARLRMGGPLDLEREPTDLVALARAAADEHQQLSERHQIRVESSETQLVGAWDAGRLKRVLDNLVGNAVKYSPNGGEVTLSLAREESANGSWATLAVRDQGIGIPTRDLRRVFERFRRAENVIGRIPGTGIGLADARQIVEQHGGRISVSSQEQAGTTFTIRLPLAQPGNISSEQERERLD